MAPIQGNPVATGSRPDREMIRSVQTDPVRILVQAALAVYLTPLVLVVCLIGGTSILVGGAARVVRHLARRKDRHSIRITGTEAGEIGSRLAAERERSHVAR